MKIQINETHQRFPTGEASLYSVVPCTCITPSPTCSLPVHCITSLPSSALPQKLGSMEGKMLTHYAVATAAERERKVHILIGDATLWREFQDEVKKAGVVTSVAVEMVLDKFIAHKMENIDNCQQTKQHPKKSRWNISNLSLKKQQTDGYFQKSIIESLTKKRASYPLGVAKTRDNVENTLAPTRPPFGKATRSMALGSLGTKGAIQATNPMCGILVRMSSLSGSPPPLNEDVRLASFALSHNQNSDRAAWRQSISEILNQACTMTERNTPLQQLRGYESASTNGFVEFEENHSMNHQDDSSEAEHSHGSRLGINVPRFWKKE